MDEQGREALEQRLKSVREATGLTQVQFLARLNQAAAKLGHRPYAQSVLSRLENGLQQPTFDDIEVYAAVDPLQRGKLWLGWGEYESPAELPVEPDPALDRKLTEAELDSYDRIAGRTPGKGAAKKKRRHNG